MVRQVLQILLVFSLILLFTHCAQIIPLSGGERDATPPKILETSPARNTTNFNAEYISLKFDEFVQVKDLSNQLIVTPRLKTTPDISADGKNILVKFKREELLPNTTYRFYFGTAIADMNESNSIPDFEYVFSTGSYIDTVMVKGDITESFDNKPVSDVLIALYYGEQTYDSLVYKKEPDFITRTKDDGTFLVKNLPYKTFSVFAFTDKNKNSLYDGEAEKIGFLDSTLTLISDTTIHLKMFQEEASKSFIKKSSSPYYGFAQIILNKKAKVQLMPIVKENSLSISETLIGREKDTISFFYKNINDTLDLVLQNFNANKSDTLRIKLPKNNLTKRRLKTFTFNTRGNKLPLYANLKLSFLNWMDTSRSDLSKIKFTSKEDSMITPIPAKGRWTSVNSYEIYHPLKEGISYTIKIDTTAFFDLNQIPNDSNSVLFVNQSKTDFGKLTLKLSFKTDSTLNQNYIIQLLDQQNRIEKEHVIVFSDLINNATTIEFTDVTPGVYFTKIIFDSNKNNKWDSGNIIRKQQAEKVIINSKQLKILSDWEIEEEILIKD
ncbi:Ig-like domain-containing protein [Aurantibacillus circumpalustris]|uniref:Ig-like domain-containing protein n=1 Tax=Aurantibacillus circumpalustris TaxID=3036359 RepID=UPI00295B9128|nr:Ig-like domain-containing protein [Aurantibacillus circumpalustris]